MLPVDEWLPKARKLAVGMTMRVRHNRESTAAMNVGNARDRWWAYCQRCKEGGVVSKEHVLLAAGPAAPAVSLVLPPDRVRVLHSDFEAAVGHFLASKNMMFPYLPELWVSQHDKRLLIQDDAGHWHGRDITGRSNSKWLNYQRASMVGTPGPTTILTEDLFSMYKIRFAIGTEHSVCCTLGAGVHDYAVLALKDCKRIVWAYDGDKAGDYGYKTGSLRMRAMGSTQLRFRPPEGMDPKDMQCKDIRALLEGVL